MTIRAILFWWYFMLFPRAHKSVSVKRGWEVNMIHYTLSVSFRLCSHTPSLSSVWSLLPLYFHSISFFFHCSPFIHLDAVVSLATPGLHLRIGINHAIASTKLFILWSKSKNLIWRSSIQRRDTERAKPRQKNYRWREKVQKCAEHS